MRLRSKVKQYEPEEVDLAALSDQAYEIFGKRPFQWQLDAAKAILCGRDVVLDVGPGNGKTLCFLLALVLDKNDIALTISPLTALMLDQASTSKLSTFSVCQETLAKVGIEKAYQDIAAGNFRQVIVSPEIAISEEFNTSVLAKGSFVNHLRVVNIDEAHCICFWGGSFRPDYASLGVLRGHFPNNISFQIASATLPGHVLEDICQKLSIRQNVSLIQLTNARPNIALSVRVMAHSDESKGDLRFLIPPTAKVREDISITLVYCNQRRITEDCTDYARKWAAEQDIPSNAIAFYHALVGNKRKREIEKQLAAGHIRILFCTDALGMGCDLRNIKRVVLWGLPPTFCALVQRAGRAGRDLKKDAEAILIIPKHISKEGTSVQETSTTIPSAASTCHVLSRDATDIEIVDREGIRISKETAIGSVDATNSTNKVKRRKKNQRIRTAEAQALLDYATTTICRRIIWDRYFENGKKLPLKYLQTTCYQPIPGMRCCDNCEPHLFPVEKVNVNPALPSLRHKKNAVSNTQRTYIQDRLLEWRDSELIDAYYGSLTSLSGATILGDNIISQLATCSEECTNYSDIERYTQWAIGYNRKTNTPTQWGNMLLTELQKIYQESRELVEAEKREEYRKNTQKDFDIVVHDVQHFDVGVSQAEYQSNTLRDFDISMGPK